MRFCYGKTLLQNFRKLFVIRHFLYVITYSLALGPLKVFILLRTYDNQITQNLNLNFCLYFNVSVGIIMFFIRSSETNFYQMLFCYMCRRNNKKEGNDSDNYFVSVPLTSIISRNMNLEFMCCSLYGLSDIFNKNEKKNMTKCSMVGDCTLNIMESDKSIKIGKFLQNENSKEKSLISREICE